MKAVHNWYPRIDGSKRLVYILTTEEECRTFEKSHENAVRLKWDEKYKDRYSLSGAYQEAIRDHIPEFGENGIPYPFVYIHWIIEEAIHSRFPIYYCWEPFSKSVYYFTELTDK